MGELLLCYKLLQESFYVYIIHQILIQHIVVFSFLLEKSIMDGVYVIFILVEHHLYFFFYFYILEELYLMVHTFIIQILGFLEFLFSSYYPLRLNTNNKIPFFPFIFLKDFLGFILILCLYLLQTHFGISSFSHPDNALEVCGLLTPLHIVP